VISLARLRSLESETISITLERERAISAPEPNDIPATLTPPRGGEHTRSTEGALPTMPQTSFDLRSDAEILSIFGMTAGEAGRGIDAETQGRVFADGLVRSRGRFAHHRALYAAFVGGGSPFMIENLDEDGDGGAVPAKLMFVDEAPAPEAAANPLTVVWTERALLEALAEERAIQDFFAGLLDELSPMRASEPSAGA
jgi:hypothetical protein